MSRHPPSGPGPWSSRPCGPAYFAYLGTAPARRLLAGAAEAARHRAVETVLAGYRPRGTVAGRTVWANVPRARVWRLASPAPKIAPPRARSASARPGSG
ncbi:hypothetical protein [Streptomyces sp. MMS24-I29]|uniref:hypothetical protein n=1 Tax=Streptomyces sp. MMS24-I29 TaxID=3351480 RepID=UPI003C7E8477